MEKKKEVKKTKKSAAAKKTVGKKVVDKKVETEVKEVASIKEEKVVEVKKDSNKKGSRHDLFKVVVLCILATVILTWIIPTGYFSGAEYVQNTVNRTGIVDAFMSMFYSINYYLLQIVFILLVGLFYGVVSKTKGYKALVLKLAKVFKNKANLFVLVSSLIIALYTSIASQFFPIIIFIPLIISVAKELKISKLNSIAMTFGAILVGLVGTTYSSYGLSYVNQNMGTTLSTAVGMRFGILAISYILLNAIIILSMNKDKKNNYELIEDTFGVTTEKESKCLGFAILFGVLFVLAILGYFPWSDGFGIDVFTKFHAWLTTEVTVTIGEKSHAIISYILGNNAVTFGSWDIYTIGFILVIALVVIKFACKIKLDDLLDNALEGIKKMAKPALYIMFAYTFFVLSYWSGFASWFVNLFNAETFNPFTNAIGNAIAQFFHVDFGYTAFSLSAFYAAKYANYTSVILTIMTSMHGLVSIVAPTSVVLLVGLSTYDVSYKSWLKYIWKFATILLVVLFLIFAVMTYM